MTKKVNTNSIASLIKSLRHRDALSLSDLAEKANLDISTISRIETGEQNPSLVTAFQISEAFNLSLVEFVQKLINSAEHESFTDCVQDPKSSLNINFAELSMSDIELLNDIADAILRNYGKGDC